MMTLEIPSSLHHITQLHSGASAAAKVDSARVRLSQGLAPAASRRLTRPASASSSSAAAAAAALRAGSGGNMLTTASYKEDIEALGCGARRKVGGGSVVFAMVIHGS
jgi:hypothetical protein